MGAKKTILFVGLCLFTWGVSGQSLLNFYNFNQVNQNLMINPSAKHNYRFVLGLPVASGVHANYNNSAFEAGQIFNDNTLGQNLDAIIPNLTNKEHINLYEATDVLFVGFGGKKAYWSFGVQQEAQFNFMIPGKLIKFMYYGNAGDQANINYTKKDFNAEALVNVNYHLGYQRFILDSNLIIGARFKFIAGAANAQFQRFNANLETSIFEWTADTDILLETSGYDLIENYSTNKLTDLIKGGNPGWGFDLGATYFYKKMVFSAAVLNVGRIKWNKDNKMYASNGSFVWQGIEANGNGDINEDVLDTISKAFDFKEIEPYSYSTQLPLHIVLNYQYQLTPKHAFGAGYQGDIWSGNLYNNFGVNYVGNYLKRFSLLLGYSWQSGSAKNFGIGISGALGPLQLYVMSDNAWGFYKMTELSSTSLRFGLNVVLYDKSLRKPKKEKKQDTKSQKPINKNRLEDLK